MLARTSDTTHVAGDQRWAPGRSGGVVGSGAGFWSLIGGGV
jgi:hypothetical protein